MADMLRWLNYHHLRAFVAIVEEGGLAPAAKRLRVTHPTLSEQLRKLENDLDLQLFDRKGRRLVLNASGRMVFEYAEQIFGIGSALLDAVEGRAAGGTVLCRVGIDSVLPKLTVKRALSPLLTRFGPSLRLLCTEADTEAVVTQLRLRQVDLVLTDAPTLERDTTIRSTVLSQSDLSFFAHPTLAAELHGSWPDRLDSAPFLMPLAGSRVRRELEHWLLREGVRPRVVGEFADSALLKAFGQDGHGIFVMPTDVAEDVVDQYGVEVLGRATGAETQVRAVHRPEPALAVQTFLELHA